MKRIVSISIGSSKRNHKAEMEVLGHRFSVERIGTDGDLKKAAQLIQDLDGKIDCFGLGGIDLYIQVGNRRYYFREGTKLGSYAKKTPIVDGSGLKNTLERRVVYHMRDRLGIELEGAKVFLVSAADRFGMAEALMDCGAKTIYGDLMFAVGLPIPLHRLQTVDALARPVVPLICKLPFSLVYPTGSKQEVNNGRCRYGRYYQWADVIAGDWHFIKKHLPQDLAGKVVLTNTVTPADVQLLKQRGAQCLVTTTPNLGGRSFGTNVMEAVLVALAGKRPEELQVSDYEYWLDQMGFEPRVEWFSEGQPLDDMMEKVDAVEKRVYN